MRKIISGMIMALLVLGVFPSAFEFQAVEAAGETIYIRANGLVDPPSAPISNVGNVSYTFTADINGSIIVERDNMVVSGAGHVLEGAGTGNGISLTGRSKVTIRNIVIREFAFGIDLWDSSGNTISANALASTSTGIYLVSSSDGNSICANNMANNQWGISLTGASNNSISANNMASNDVGISLTGASNNSVSANNITNNNVYGISLSFISNNKISANNIADNSYGIYLYSPSGSNSISANNIANNDVGISLTGISNNLICHNNFVGNTVQAQVIPPECVNVWDAGYPSGGNFWSDYAGIDANHDGLGDTPYVIDASNVDHYPLISPWNPTLSVLNVTAWHWFSDTTVNSVAVGDVDGDGQEETVTGGSYYDGMRSVAQLVVWNSFSLVPERLTSWYWFDNTTINSLVVGDADGDGQVEIVTGGTFYDGVRNVAQLVVWAGSDLAVKRLRTWYWGWDTKINSVAIGDVDGDSQVEIVTGGYYFDGVRKVAQLVVWNGSDLSVDKIPIVWYWTGSTAINSVALGDVDGDGQTEIVTGGYYNDGIRDVAQLVEWAGSSVAVDRLTTWYWIGDTVINSVALRDVDADGQTEVVTGGYFNDGVRNVAQLVVWAGSDLSVDGLTAWYWTGNTVINSVALGDIDGDDQVEIVTGGYYHDGIRNVAQLVAWNGCTLAAKYIRTWYWFSDTVINSVCLGDINGDFSDEIATGGAYDDWTRRNAQLVVWGVKQSV